MKRKILIIEDDANIRAGLADALTMEGYEVTEAPSGFTGLQAYEENKPHLILLDLMMPGMNGYDVCRKIRRNDEATPIVILTAKGEEIDKVLGLELGADDYVTKPFSLRELSARIAARLRQVHTEVPVVPESFDFGPWIIDAARLQGHCENKQIELTAREVALLRFFAAHPGIALRRDRIMREVWGMEFSASRTLDQHMVTLRRKLMLPGEADLLESVYGVGYRYTAPAKSNK